MNDIFYSDGLELPEGWYYASPVGEDGPYETREEAERSKRDYLENN